MEDDPAQHSREHEVGARIDDADTDCAACQRESTCEQSPPITVSE